MPTTTFEPPTTGQQLRELRPSLLAGPSGLSRAARVEIAGLSGARPLRFFAELTFTWLVVAALIAVGARFSDPFVTLVCIILIATRQIVLGLLMHEQTHRLGLRTKYGDWIVNVLTTYPLLVVTIEGYAKVHLSHHKHFMTPKDPDFVRKSGRDWAFPASPLHVLRLACRDLSGFSTLQLIRGKKAPGVAEFSRLNPTPLWLRLAFFVALASALTAIHGWTLFLIYWVLPLLTVTQLLLRWLAVLEHRYNVPGASVLDVTPLVLLKGWQRLLLPDLNFAMHAYHHLHTGVSFSNLPKLHEIYRREGLVVDSAVFNGLGAYFKHVVSGLPTNK